MSDVTKKPEETQSAAADDVDLVRRRLLAAGGRYVAPALLASLFLGEQALAQAGCPPYFNSCQPFRQCQPGACVPIGGGS